MDSQFRSLCSSPKSFISKRLTFLRLKFDSAQEKALHAPDHLSKSDYGYTSRGLSFFAPFHIRFALSPICMPSLVLYATYLLYCRHQRCDERRTVGANEWRQLSGWQHATVEHWAPNIAKVRIYRHLLWCQLGQEVEQTSLFDFVTRGRFSLHLKLNTGPRQQCLLGILQ